MQHDRPPKIPVVCVSSHQHVLEHIHDILRRRRLLTKPWSMLHFDSHADLACPGEHIPAACCFQPRKEVGVGIKTSNDGNNRAGDEDKNKRNLYELLDSTPSGIAEWILPLVLAANLNSVHWIRPATNVRLIPSGQHAYYVGAWIHDNPMVDAPESVRSFLDLPDSAIVKVDWNCAYYAEDGSCVSHNELMLARPLQLTVEEKSISSTSSETINKVNNFNSDDYDVFALDVCLDFFACLNPFVVDIESIDEELARALVAVVVEADLYQQHEAVGEPCPATITKHSDSASTFRQLLQGILEACHDRASAVLDTKLFNDLIIYYSSEEKARSLIERVAILLQRHDENLQQLIQLATEALPNLSMPHERSLNNRSQTMENVSIQHRLEILKSTIHSNQYKCGDPFIITVARSSDDGFTPMSIVEELQESVLKIIHKRYCGCREPNLRPPELDTSGCSSDCRFDLIFDYSEWEGSTFTS